MTALSDLKQKRTALLLERKALNLKLESSTDDAKAIYNLIFKQKFREGGAWLDRVKSNAKRDKLVVGLLGGVRHLWVYLHPERRIQSDGDRRAPNSIVQGPASNLGFIGGYFLRKLIWEWFESRGIDLGVLFCNSVHDATEVESPYINIPLVNYLATHAYSTLIHSWMRDSIGFETIISFEMDCAIGPSLANMSEAIRWDDQVAAIRKGMEWKRDNLGLKQPIEEIMEVVEHNAKIIFDIRQREILSQLKSNEQVGYTMEMSRDNCLKFGLKFDTPKARVNKLREQDAWRKELVGR
jgi:hypothetical protein